MMTYLTLGAKWDDGNIRLIAHMYKHQTLKLFPSDLLPKINWTGTEYKVY